MCCPQRSYASPPELLQTSLINTDSLCPLGSLQLSIVSPLPKIHFCHMVSGRSQGQQRLSHKSLQFAGTRPSGSIHCSSTLEPGIASDVRSAGFLMPPMALSLSASRQCFIEVGQNKPYLVFGAPCQVASGGASLIKVLFQPPHLTNDPASAVLTAASSADSDGNQGAPHLTTWCSVPKGLRRSPSFPIPPPFVCTMPTCFLFLFVGPLRFPHPAQGDLRRHAYIDPACCSNTSKSACLRDRRSETRNSRPCRCSCLRRARRGPCSLGVVAPMSAPFLLVLSLTLALGISPVGLFLCCPRFAAHRDRVESCSAGRLVSQPPPVALVRPMVWCLR